MGSLEAIKCLPKCLYIIFVLFSILVIHISHCAFIKLKLFSSEQHSLRENLFWSPWHRANRHSLKPVHLLLSMRCLCTYSFNGNRRRFTGSKRSSSEGFLHLELYWKMLFLCILSGCHLLMMTGKSFKGAKICNKLPVSKSEIKMTIINKSNIVNLLLV